MKPTLAHWQLNSNTFTSLAHVTQTHLHNTRQDLHPAQLLQSPMPVNLACVLAVHTADLSLICGMITSIQNAGFFQLLVQS